MLIIIILNILQLYIILITKMDKYTTPKGANNQGWGAQRNSTYDKNKRDNDSRRSNFANAGEMALGMTGIF